MHWRDCVCLLFSIRVSFLFLFHAPQTQNPHAVPTNTTQINRNQSSQENLNNIQPNRHRIPSFADSHPDSRHSDNENEFNDRHSDGESEQDLEDQDKDFVLLGLDDDVAVLNESSPEKPAPGTGGSRRPLLARATSDTTAPSPEQCGTESGGLLDNDNIKGDGGEDLITPQAGQAGGVGFTRRNIFDTPSAASVASVASEGGSLFSPLGSGMESRNSFWRHD